LLPAEFLALNRTAVDYPRSKTIAQLFAEQVEKSPDAIAVIAGSVQLTYRQLSARSDKIASYLQQLGVDTETLVGVATERSEHMLIAILAVLKAGGAYVPLDPDYPEARISSMVEDSGSSLILSTSDSLSKLPATSAKVIALDQVIVDLPSYSQPVSSAATSSNLAYVIYTSGSTGKPKGVMIEHRNVVNFFTAMDRLIGNAPGVWLAVTSMAFDISVLELLWTLTRGFTVVLHSGNDPHSVAREIQDFRVTHFQSTPSLARILSMDSAVLSAFAGLKVFLLGGEVLPASLVNQIRTVFHGDLYNMYGPTETTIWSSAYHITDFDSSIPIGVPIANNFFYILDENLDPVAKGQSGGLYIGGEGVVRGYLDNPELTVQRFLTDPFSPGGRMYRTGDVARLLPTGNIDFLGRMDHQVKIRGFRIELGEIEAVLERLPEVHQAVVVAREEKAADIRLVAYIVLSNGLYIDSASLRSHLRDRLPAFMVPAQFVFIDSLPLTANGKIDRNALPAASPKIEISIPTTVAQTTELEAALIEVFADALGVQQIPLTANFFDLGAHSLLIAEVHSRLQDKLAREISLVDLFEFPTVASLARHLGGVESSVTPSRTDFAAASRSRGNRSRHARPGSSIAIVGMAGRFPGARDIRQFWNNIRDGVESIRRLTDEELLAAGVRPEDIANPDYVKAAPILDGIDQFDAPFFGFSPRDASIMDPQHRHFLECTWEALENAGHSPDKFPGSVAVFAGSGLNTYLIYNLLTNRKLMESAGLFLLKQTGNDKDVLATRVSYQLNLRGPSINVQTACSTSLVAVHLACQALQNQECDMALAGGVTIECPHGHGYMYREGEILSRDGHCRSFDASSSGTVFSSGAGAVVLRRLEDAIADRDTIHAVILSSAINNDGARKVGFLAPSVEGQAEVVSEAIGVAGIFADTISYVETHGTGTVVGDPIEIKALTRAFRATTQRKNFCAVGSLKSNVGHLDAAAGVAGLIKTTLALENKQIPASLHFENPNPMIDFAGSPFFVNAKLANWAAGNAPRRAGVTSLGIGGTNAHVILEEAPPLPLAQGEKPFQLLTVSAKTETALKNSCNNLASYISDNPSLRLADIAFTLQAGRKEFPIRRAFVAADHAQAVRALRGEETRNTLPSKTIADSPHVVFLFSGQGSQYVGMCRGLYESEPVFRENLDRCADSLLPLLRFDLRQVLFPDSANAETIKETLNQTWLTQPALFSIEYSLAQWWKSIGVTPKAMLGHSIGEYVAACLAGVFSFEDALAVTTLRGRLMQDLPAGAMLAVPVPPSELAVPPGLSLAAVNSPDQCVVSGPFDLIDQFEKTLVDRGITGRRLHTSHAFHSAMMDPILETFTKRLSDIRLHSPQIPFLSNVTGDWITSEQATDPAYWANHLRRTVRFSDCLSKLFEKPDRLLLEVGPGQVLTSLARQHTAKNAPVLPSTRHVHDSTNDGAFLLSAVAQLWIHGQTFKWSALHLGETVGRIPLPTYPFDHQRYWIEGGESIQAPAARPPSSIPTPQSAVSFHRPSFRAQQLAPGTSASAAPWLLLQDSTPLAAALRKRLIAEGKNLIEVFIGDTYRVLGQGKYRVRISRREDFEAVVADLIQKKSVPSQIVHLLSLGILSAKLDLDTSLNRSFSSLLFFAQALADQDLSGIDIAIVSDRLHSLDDHKSEAPLQAPLLGPVRVIPKDFPGITCRNIDLDQRELNATEAAKILVEECSSPSFDPVVAYRRSQRFVESVETLALPEPSLGKLRENGVYLITGGTGGIGLVLAEHLARTVRAKLILLSRTGAPPRSEWRSLAESQNASYPERHRARKLLAIEALGSEVQICSADVSNLDEMQKAVEAGHHRFGRIHGVIHAAGVLDDSPFQFKSAESASRVFAPKIAGTLVLEKVFAGAHLDFLMLCSSVSSLLPPAGQVDYAAANAFLDAFVSSKPDVPAIAVNWGLWKDVGMGDRASTAVHPLLDKRTLDTGDELGFSSQFSCSKHWLLEEHRFKNGTALVPGTGFLEMAIAAMGSLSGSIELRDVFFLAPLSVPSEGTRQVRLSLKRDASSFQFSVYSQEVDWRECATGLISRTASKPPQKCDLASLAAKCSRKELIFDAEHRTLQEKFLNFGPRWRNLKSIRLGEGECLSSLQLPPEFHSDLNAYTIHPALLDLATGSALYLIGDYASSDRLYLPISYKRLVIHGRLPGRTYSYIRSVRPNRAIDDIVAFDITVLDESGSPLIEIEEFSLRKIENPDTVAGDILPERPAPILALTGSPVQSERLAISADEGARAFQRILSAQASRIIASADDFQAQLQLDRATRSSSRIPSRAPSAELASREGVEAQLTGIWKDLLGVDQIGPNDNFFDLGGHSLLAARLSAKVKKIWGISLPLATLFQAPTIASLSVVLSGKSVPKGSPRVAAIKPDGHRPPFLCVDAGPFFRQLAQRLKPEQPFLGLRLAETDSLPTHYSMADIAAYHIRTIREIQPEGPYYLGGWSAGGLVAFEVAQQLTSQGQEVPLIVLFDVVNWNGLNRSTLWRKIAAALYLFGWKVKRHTVALWSLRGEALRAHLRDSMKQLRVGFNRILWMISDRKQRRSTRQGKTEPPDASKAVYVAARAYFPKTYPGRAVLFRCEAQPMGPCCDSQLGWSGLLRDSLKIIEMPGDHDDMFQLPHVDLLAREMDQVLDEAFRQHSSVVTAETD